MQTKFPSKLKAFTKDGSRGKDASDDQCGVSVGQYVTTESLPMLLRSTSVIYILSTVSNRGQFGL